MGNFPLRKKNPARYFVLLTSRKVLGISECSFTVWGNVALIMIASSLPMIETKSYAPFIKATNTALVCLEEILVEGMRAASSDLEMICQRNDMPIYQKHQTDKSKRIPDVFILPSKSSKEASPDAANPPWDHRVQNAAKKLKGGRIFWKDVLASIEFKRTPNFELEGPSASYQLEKYTPTDPEYRKVPVREASAGSATAVSVLQIQAEQPAPDLPRKPCISYSGLKLNQHSPAPFEL